MSVSLTSSGYGIDSYRKLGVVHINGSATTGTNYPIGSVISLMVSNRTVSLTGKWTGIKIEAVNAGYGMTFITGEDSIASASSSYEAFYLIQRVG